MSQEIDELKTKIHVLNSSLWESRNKWPRVEAWLANFSGQVAGVDEERLHALYILSQFVYFGSREMRELLRALYRDLVACPLLQAIRKSMGGARDLNRIEEEFEKELKATRFFGVGNPSESGTHLLYFFRQENGLRKSLFWETHKIFSRTQRADGTFSDTLRDDSIKRYVFIDDLCGSGSQARDYSKDLVENLLSLNPRAEVCYYALFATQKGLEFVRQHTRFMRAEAVYELDSSYRIFEDNSRFLADLPAYLKKDLFRKMAEHYGELLYPRNALGFSDGQLLMGFHHNTPDNTLPIVWSSGEGSTSWTPIFRRYPKIYDFSSI